MEEIKKERLTSPTPETIAKFSSLDTIPWDTFHEMVKAGTITRTCKLRKKRTIFFDEETQMFIYYNRYFKALVKCGFFTEQNEE
jgi:hypothetical protein